MVKSVSRFSGLFAICLIVTLIVPIIQCLPVGNELNSSDRFKRNVGLAGPGSQTTSTSTASSKATAGSISPFVLPFMNGGLLYPGGGGVDSSGLSGLLQGKLTEDLIPILFKTLKPLTLDLQQGVVNPLFNTLGNTVGGLSGGLTGLFGDLGSTVGGLLGNGGAPSQAPSIGYQLNPATIYALLASKLGSNVQTTAKSSATGQAASYIQ